MNKKVTLLNIVLSLLLQLVGIVSGLIIPKLVLSVFGSSVNGLVSSINQFLNYIVLIEGGITGVISANLYKPLVQKDWQKTSSVLTTARAFYRKIGLIFIIYTIIIGVVYPRIVNTGYTSSYVFALTCVLSVGLLLQYMFSLTMTTLLNADKKIYVVSLLSIMLTLGNIGLVIAVVKFSPDIILLNAASAALFALKPIALGVYINKHYNLDWSISKDNALIRQRWNGFAINFAFFIHTSTDITVLTLMSDLKVVSVYSIYYLVVSKVCVLIHSIASGIEPTIGQAYAKNNIDELCQKLDLYEYIIFFSVGILFSMTGILITPFVQLYTAGITDTDYFQPIFGFILVFAEALYVLKYPHVTLSYAANKFKEITVPAYIEAIINIVVSVLLVNSLGLIGIAIGTASGMLYRMIFHIHFTSRLIPGRKQFVFYKKFLIMAIVTMVAIVLSQSVFPMKVLTVSSWLVHAIIYFLIFVFFYFVASVMFFKKEVECLLYYIKEDIK